MTIGDLAKIENVVGTEWYTYYINLTQRQTRIYRYTGLFKIKILDLIPYEFNPTLIKVVKEVVETYGNKSIDEVKPYMNSCSGYYKTYEEAVEAHDAMLKFVIASNRCNPQELRLINSKLINKMIEK